MILLLGYRADPHLAEVRELVIQQGFACTVFDPTSGDRISLRLGAHRERATLVTCDSTIDPAGVTAVWARVKPVVPQADWSPLRLSAEYFRQDEWRTALRRLEVLLTHCYWINPPEAQRHIGAKPNQLALAQRCGLKIPPTLVSNDLDAVLEFFDGARRVVFKALHLAAFADQTGMYTTEIDRTFIEENAAAVRHCPGVYQELVEKSCEYRVTIVGDSRVYTARIASPDHADAGVDWRRAYGADMFSSAILPGHVEDRLLHFHQAAGLQFGAYDLALSSGGEHYFFECNASGQYLWLKEACGVDVSPGVASALCEGARRIEDLPARRASHRDPDAGTGAGGGTSPAQRAGDPSSARAGTPARAAASSTGGT